MAELIAVLAVVTVWTALGAAGLRVYRADWFRTFGHYDGFALPMQILIIFLGPIGLAAARLVYALESLE